ncbi:hypothetical protein C7445_108131 [Alicyclobacillus sacchari]|uniref:Uncharacterized protein n=1 Tax=Alicyclobacillus sacchari TaxID=392010 RepID=A0A4R8LL48_9BACL|nr:hypothetical protein [Alicyclobacillus sacchari]TDY45307.1 hypothetical protein C7445_108131 [Alicyclobacillus sacchari]
MRWRWLYSLWGMLLCIAIGLGSAPSVLAAQGTMNAGLIRTSTTQVAPGQAVGDIVVVGHNLTIAGIADHVLVINGNVTLLPTSRVDMVVDLGGAVHTVPGAKVYTVFHASLTDPFWSGALVTGLGALAVWGGLLAVSIVLTLLLTVIAAALRETIRVPLAEMQRSVRRVGLTGLFVSVGAVAFCALLAATLVGIPFAVLCFFLYAVAAIVGLAVVAVWIGRMVVNDPAQRPVWVVALVGVSLLVAFCNIPFVGLLLFCLAWVVGVGVTTHWLWMLWSMRKGRRRPSTLDNGEL